MRPMRISTGTIPVGSAASSPSRATTARSRDVKAATKRERVRLLLRGQAATATSPARPARRPTAPATCATAAPTRSASPRSASGTTSWTRPSSCSPSGTSSTQLETKVEAAASRPAVTLLGGEIPLRTMTTPAPPPKETSADPISRSRRLTIVLLAPLRRQHATSASPFLPRRDAGRHRVDVTFKNDVDLLINPTTCTALLSTLKFTLIALADHFRAPAPGSPIPRLPRPQPSWSPSAFSWSARSPSGRRTRSA